MCSSHRPIEGADSAPLYYQTCRISGDDPTWCVEHDNKWRGGQDRCGVATPARYAWLEDGPANPDDIVGATTPQGWEHSDEDSVNGTDYGPETPGYIGIDTNGHPVYEATPEIAARLEELRAEIRAERISYGELAELQSLAEYIDKGDVELLEAAGVPEFGCDDCGALAREPHGPDCIGIEAVR